MRSSSLRSNSGGGEDGSGMLVSLEQLEELCMTTRSQYYDGFVEGIYVRIDRNGWNVARGKVVRPDFIQSIEASGHWMSKRMVRNTLRATEYAEVEVVSTETNSTSYPRTPHLPFSPGGTDDDLRLNTASLFEGQSIVVTEKLDGGCCSLRSGKVYARSHAQEATHPSFSRVKELAASLANVPECRGVVLYGENMTAIHSIDYDGLATFFYLFGAKEIATGRWWSWDEVEEFAASVGMTTVPVVVRAPEGMSGDSMERMMVNESQQMSKASQAVCPEGFVVRVAGSFDDSNFQMKVAKYVRSNHVQTDSTWRRTWRKAKIES